MYQLIRTFLIDVQHFTDVLSTHNIRVFFVKGDMVMLVGSVHINRFEKDGQKRIATEVKVEEIHFSGGKKNNAPAENSNANPYAETENDPLF